MLHKSQKKISRSVKTPSSIHYVKSAVLAEDYPSPTLPEVCIVGRSNAGKSSLINAIYGSRIAKVSSSPGKTRLVNFFEVPEKYRLIDLPGYGFAARSESERVSWRNSVETYLSTRDCLLGIVLVVDIRRDWQLEESDLLHWLSPRQLPWLLVLSKSDKLTKSQIHQRTGDILASLKIQGLSKPDEVIVTSALKKTNVREVEEFFYKNWVRPAGSMRMKFTEQ